MTEQLPAQLRDAALTERDDLVKYNLNLIADEIMQAVVAFAICPTSENLATVQSHWGNGMRKLDYARERAAR